MATSVSMECTICLRTFNQPRLIDCHHTFCLACLEDYVPKFTKNGSFPCPLCRKEIKVPAGGVNKFTANFYLGDKIPKTNMTCENHDEARPVELYCNQCHVPVCSKCFTTMHNGHSFLDLESDDAKTSVQKNQSELKNQLESCLEKYTEHFEELTNKYLRLNITAKTATEKLEKTVETICEKVKSYEEKFKETIKSVEEREKDKLNKCNEEVQKTKQEIKKYIATLTNAVSDDTIVDVLTTFPKIQQLLSEDENRELRIPNVCYPMFKLFEDPFEVTKDKLGAFDVSQEIIFTSEFSYDTIKDGTNKICAEDKHELGKLSFSLAARNRTDKLGLYLNFNENEKSKDLKYCTVLFSIKLISHTDSKKSKALRQEYTFKTTGQSWGWSFIDWEKFVDESNGYIDENKHFHVECRALYTDIKWKEEILCQEELRLEPGLYPSLPNT